MAVIERTFRPPHAVNLRLTLAPLRNGSRDPATGAASCASSPPAATGRPASAPVRPSG